MSKLQGVEYRTADMTASKLEQIGNRILSAMNDAQTEDGYTADEVVMGALYALGAALGMRRAVLDHNSPLGAQLPPLVRGYTTYRRRNAN